MNLNGSIFYLPQMTRIIQIYKLLNPEILDE